MHDQPILEQPDIVFIVGCLEGESKRYRVYNLVEGLQSLGYTCFVTTSGYADEIIERRLVPRVAVFFRALFEPAGHSIALLEYFRRNLVRTVYDTDDYVFEPSIIPQIAGIANFSREELAAYEWSVRAYRTLMFCCDLATASTPFLVERMRQLGRQAALVPNTINAAQRRLADELLVLPKRRDGLFRIGYFSGSHTHARDFYECEDALLEVLRRHSHARFVLAGYLELSPRWADIAHQVQRLPFMSSLEMLGELHALDVNIAPLEEGNIFCDAKSELKFFEAGLVKTVTIASRTDSMIRCMQDGQNGILASGRAEWAEKIECLIARPAYREKLGLAARETAISLFTTEKAAKMATVIYGLEEDVGDRLAIIC